MRPRCVRAPWRYGAHQNCRDSTAVPLAPFERVREFPWLRIGETRYSPLKEARGASAVGSALLCVVLAAEATTLPRRQNRAQWFRTKLVEFAQAHHSTHPADVRDEALRYPPIWLIWSAVIVSHALLERSGLAALGVVGSYPRTLRDYAEFRHFILNGAGPFPGVSDLVASLLTLSTHSQISDELALEIVSRPRSVLRARQRLRKHPNSALPFRRG